MELTEERMSDGEGIRVLSEPDGKAGTQPPSTPAPVVVIEYRQASLWHRFLPALLVFLAAIPISLFQRQTPVRLIPNRSMLVTPAPASNPATTPAAVTPSPTLDTAPIVAKFADADGKSVDPDLSKTAAAPPKKDQDKAGVSLFEIDPSDGLKPVELVTATPGTKEPNEPDFASEEPPASADNPTFSSSAPTPVETPASDEAAAPAEPMPEVPRTEPTKDDILNEIRREAEEKEAERKRLADLKPQAKALMLAESIERAASDRQPFHDSLKALIQGNDPDLYQMVDNLCNRYGRSLSDEMKVRYLKARKLFPNRMTKQAEVLAMRKLGLPEPMILDYLVNKALKTINGLSGPANEREAVIAASKQLLAIRLTPKEKDKDPAARSASARKAGADSTVASGDPSAKTP